jgi:tetratricopeptide (TPR) repeat protein
LTYSRTDLNRAMADYDEAIRLNPKYAPAYFNRGLGFKARNEYERAIADFNEAIRLDPNMATAYANRGWAWRNKNDYTRAIADFDEAIRLDPKYAFAFGERGIAYHNKRDYNRAIADYDTAIRLDPRNANTFYNRGQALRVKGEFDRAIADYDEAVRLDVKFALAYRDRGQAYLAKEDFDLAIANLSVAIRLAPNDAFAFVYRGRAEALKGEFAAAAADGDQAVTLSPNNGEARNLRGFAYKGMGDLNRALPDLDEAIRLTPNLVSAYTNRGDVYLEKGDFARAIADLSEAIRLAPSNTAAYASRGLAYEKKGDIDLARADFSAAMALPQTRSVTAKAALETARTRLAALSDLKPIDLTKPVEPPKPVNLAKPVEPVKPAITTGQPEKRIALVIGNSTYRNAPALPNARRDADAIASALRGVGFQTVTLQNDLSKDKLGDALRAFARQAEQADWALIYYAGHGIEMSGTNYLIPVDARLETDRDVQFEALPLDQVMSSVEGAHKLRIILLDACRENPFARQMRRTVASRTIGRGLARIEPDGGTLVAYAAKHGEVALDGEGENSPFVTAFVRHIATPGVEINKLFRLVRDDVLAATGRRQEPFVYGSLPGEDFYFNPPLAAAQ